MNIEEAFGHIVAKLQAANDSGIRPSIRVAGPDWVCTIDDKQTKFVIIAKEEALMLVSMKLQKGEPDVQRIHAPEYTQQNLVDRIRKAIVDIYGALPKE
ncbi:MAG: hypothetical protein ACLP5H_05555 [Desulfomonilaceae bacterium]